MSAAVAELPCHMLRLPDVFGWLQAALLGLMPGKPFSLDNFRSLTVDSVCTQNGFARLGISPRHIMAVLPFFLGPFTGPTELNAARKSID